jgi:hypothetical protein
MFAKIAYFPILGMPVIFYLGIITILCLFFTATVGYLNLKGINKIPLKWHFRMAKITVALAIIHGMLGVLSYL